MEYGLSKESGLVLGVVGVSPGNTTLIRAGVAGSSGGTGPMREVGTSQGGGGVRAEGTIGSTDTVSISVCGRRI